MARDRGLGVAPSFASLSKAQQRKRITDAHARGRITATQAQAALAFHGLNPPAPSSPQWAGIDRAVQTVTGLRPSYAAHPGRIVSDLASLGRAQIETQKRLQRGEQPGLNELAALAMPAALYKGKVPERVMHGAGVTYTRAKPSKSVIYIDLPGHHASALPRRAGQYSVFEAPQQTLRAEPTPLQGGEGEFLHKPNVRVYEPRPGARLFDMNAPLDPGERSAFLHHFREAAQRLQLPDAVSQGIALHLRRNKASRDLAPNSPALLRDAIQGPLDLLTDLGDGPGLSSVEQGKIGMHRALQTRGLWPPPAARLADKRASREWQEAGYPKRQRPPATQLVEDSYNSLNSRYNLAVRRAFKKMGYHGAIGEETMYHDKRAQPAPLIIDFGTNRALRPLGGDKVPPYIREGSKRPTVPQSDAIPQWAMDENYRLGVQNWLGEKRRTFLAGELISGAERMRDLPELQGLRKQLRHSKDSMSFPISDEWGLRLGAKGTFLYSPKTGQQMQIAAPAFLKLLHRARQRGKLRAAPPETPTAAQLHEQWGQFPVTAPQWPKQPFWRQAQAAFGTEKTDAWAGEAARQAQEQAKAQQPPQAPKNQQELESFLRAQGVGRRQPPSQPFVNKISGVRLPGMVGGPPRTHMGVPLSSFRQPPAIEEYFSAGGLEQLYRDYGHEMTRPQLHEELQKKLNGMWAAARTQTQREAKARGDTSVPEPLQKLFDKLSSDTDAESIRRYLEFLKRRKGL